MRRYTVVCVVLLNLLWRHAYPQTAVDLRTQSKNVDFSAASATKPSKTGTTLPAACSVGETFFLTTAAAGQNLYFCTSSNVWTVQGQTAQLVTSVFGREGTVTSQSGDYTFGQITGTVSNSQISSGIDAAKIGTGKVNATSFDYLANVTSDIQAQLNAKAGSAHSHVSGGDLNGDLSATTVVALQNRRVAATAPSDQQALSWNAPAGQWEPRTISAGSGGGATISSQLEDITATRSSDMVLTIGGTCSAATPCPVRFGSNVFSITSSATATISAGSGTAYIYVTPAGTLTVGHSMTVSCSGCTTQGGISAFPSNSLPLYTWTATSGTWDVGGGADKRAFLSTKTLTASTGITLTETAGETGVAVNPAVVATFTSGTGAAPATCSIGEIYLKTDTSQVYQCTATNTFTEVTGGTVGLTLSSTVTDEIYYPAANYDGNAASSRTTVVTPNGYAPTASVAGTAPWRYATLNYSSTAAQYAIFTHHLPSTWSSNDNVTMDIRWLQTGGVASGNAVWRVNTACKASGEDIQTEPTWNSNQDQAIAEPGMNLLLNSSWTLTKTGCAAGKLMFIRVGRIGDDAADTAAHVSQMLGITVKHKRTLQ